MPSDTRPATENLAAMSVRETLSARSVRETLTASETVELNDALCDPTVWTRAAELYGIAGLVRHRRAPDGLAAVSDAGLDDDVQRFGSLIIRNPHVADWFSVFCPEPGVMAAVRSALKGYSPVKAFERGVAEILGTLGTGTERLPSDRYHNSGGHYSCDSYDDRLVVASAALCSGLIAFERADAVVRFLGLDSPKIYPQ